MAVERFELNLANVGLGGLNERALLALFATAQAHRLMEGTGSTLSQIVDAEGTALYPGFVRTHLFVPAPCELDHFRVWDIVDVGVDLKRYGPMLLDATMVLGRAGEVAPTPADWKLEQTIHMKSASMFVVDNRDDAEVAAPQKGTVAELPMLKSRPTHLDEARRVRIAGDVRPALLGDLLLQDDHAYRVLPDRDAGGGNMMFATFTTILDAAEYDLLTQKMRPRLADALLPFRRVVEREVFYLGNARAGERVRVELRARIDPCPQAQDKTYERLRPVGTLESSTALYAVSTGTILCAAYTRKLLTAPVAHARLVQDLERFVGRHRSTAAECEERPTRRTS